MIKKTDNSEDETPITKYGTDLERLRNMTDEDIDYSDIPPITDDMWKNGVWRRNFKPIEREGPIKNKSRNR